MSFAHRPPAGTRLHVEFDGVVQCDDTQKHLTTKPWQVVVTDHDPTGVHDVSGRLHLVNFEADTVTEIEQPTPVPAHWPPKVGEVWLHGPSDLLYHVRRNLAYDDQVVLTREGDNEEVYVSSEGEDPGLNEGIPSEWERKLSALKRR